MSLLICSFIAFKPNDYKLIDSLENLDKKRKEYKEYEIKVKMRNLSLIDTETQKEESAEDLFNEDLLNKFIICTTENIKANNKRKDWFHKSILFIWINLALCFIIMILLIVATYWNTSMPDEKKNPPVPKPAETEAVSVKNTIPLSESYTTDYSENSPTPPKEGDKDK